VDADRIITEIAAEQHAAVSRRQLLDAGLSRRALEHRLATGRLLRVHAGVYRLAGHPPSALQSLTAACLAAGPGVAVSHRGAAFLHGIGGIGPRPEVSVSGPRSPRPPGVLVHRVGQLVRPDVGTVDGLRCTRPARTVIDLAAVVGRAALAVALDDALSRRLLTCSYLRQRIEVLGRQGRAGTATLVDLLDDRADGRPQSTSEFERRLFELLRSGGLPVPRPQFEVALPGGRTAFVDYAYPDVLLGIEADSFRHHASRTDWSRDRTRNNLLIAAGWRILPVTWDDVVTSPDELLALLDRSVRSNPHQRGQSAQPSSHGRRASMAAG
jgi:very-short-patch-repair endonuclease